MSQSQYKVAGFLERLGVCFLSWFLWAMLALKLYQLFAFEQLQYFLALFFALSLFDHLLLAFTGFTVLQFIFGLRTVDAHSAEPIGLIRAFFRYIAAILSFGFLGLGYLAALFDPAKRTVHDMVFSAVMIRDRKLYFLSTFFSKIFTLPALVFALMLYAAIPFSGYLLAKSYIEFKQDFSYDALAWQRNPANKVELNLSNQTATALTEIKSVTADYLPFTFKPDAKLNNLSLEAVNVLGLKPWNMSYKLTQLPSSLDELLTWDMNRLQEISLIRFVLIDRLVFKDQFERDLILENLKFSISDEESYLGQDFFIAFEHNLDFNRNRLQLGLARSEQEYFANPKLEEQMRDYFISALNQVRRNWYYYQGSMPVELIDSLSQAQVRPSSSIVLYVDAASGFVKEAKVIKPSKNKEFDEFCKKFLSELAKFSKVPAAFADDYPGLYELKLDLDARF